MNRRGFIGALTGAVAAAVAVLVPSRTPVADYCEGLMRRGLPVPAGYYRLERPIVLLPKCGAIYSNVPQPWDR